MTPQGRIIGSAQTSNQFPGDLPCLLKRYNQATLPQSWANQRLLRLADGPDEVHNRAISRLELKKYT